MIIGRHLIPSSRGTKGAERLLFREFDARVFRIFLRVGVEIHGIPILFECFHPERFAYPTGLSADFRFSTDKKFPFRPEFHPSG